MIWPLTKPYDPTWLVEAAEQVKEEYAWLPEALSECTKTVSISRVYVRFISSRRANKPEATWQFQESIILEDTMHGDVVLDILSGNRVGGVEFLSRLLEK